ncbi:MAG TPA: hypothetical protein DDW65_21135 [Firmicutes bacterium]|nr:hypothetical protein [Bacillota bacterium]
MSKIIKSEQWVETHPRQLPSVDVDAFFIQDSAAKSKSPWMTLPKNPLSAEDAPELTEAATSGEQPGSGEQVVPESAASKLSDELQKEAESPPSESISEEPDDDEEVNITINPVEHRRLASVLLDYDEQPNPKLQPKQDKPWAIPAASKTTAVKNWGPSDVNLDHIADVAATLESLFSGAKQQAPTAEDTRPHAEDIINGAGKRAADTLEEAKQRANQLTFGAESKVGSILGEANQQAGSILNTAKSQAELVVTGARQQSEELLEKSKQEAETIIATANQEATKMIDDARTQTAAMIEEANQQSVTIKEQAHQQGLADGRQDAVSLVKKELSENLTQALGLINEIETERRQRLNSSEPELLKLAVAIAEKIIGEELKLDPMRQLTIIREALARVTTASVITIRIHPDDLSVVRGNLVLLQSSLSEPKPIKIEEDGCIPIGSCFIETDQGNLDARTKSQLDRVMTELLKVGTIE